MKPVLTVTAPKVVTFGVRPRLEARATLPDGTPIPGTTLTLQWLPAGATRWVPVSTGKTAPDGSAVFTPLPARSGQWRVVLPASIGRSLGVSKGAPVGVKSVIQAALVTPGVSSRAATNASVRAGATVVVAGRVMPVGVAQTVVLTRRTPTGAWATVARGATLRTGKYAFRLPTTTRGGTIYRVVTRSSAALLGGASTPLSLRVR